MIELTVTIKTLDDGTYRKKFLVYEEIAFSAEHPIVKSYIDQALSEVKGEIDSVKIRAVREV